MEMVTDAKPGPPHSFIWGHLKYLGKRIDEEGHKPELFTSICREYSAERIVL